MSRKPLSSKMTALLSALLLSGLAACGSSGGTVAAGAGDELLGEQVTFKIVSFTSVESKHMFGYEVFLEELEKSFGDTLQIDYLGAGEVIDPFEQPDAVRSGVVDIVFTGATYPEGVVPVAPAMEGSLLTPAEERNEGVFDMWQKVYEEQLNSVYLGRFLVNRVQHLYTGYQISNLDDFKGRTFRASPAQEPLLKELGASAVILSPGEVFTSLERGVIDGYGWPSVGMVDLGLGPLTAYRIDPGFYSGAGIMLMNADAMARLPEAAQEEMLKVAERVETRVAEEMRQLVEAETEQIKSEFGVEILVLEGSEAERYQELAYSGLWNQVLEASAEEGQEFYNATFEGRTIEPPLQ